MNCRVRHRLVVLLTVNSGATDALGFLALGGAFTSVMTGNMVLLGIAGGQADGALAAHTAAAIVAYVAGCALGARIAGPPSAGGGVWPAAVTRALAVELALVAGLAVGWWYAAAAPGQDAQLALLAGNALALGVQSSAVQRFGVSGLSTTYMTGTLTTIVVRLVSGHRPRDVGGSAGLLTGLVGGAVAMACLVRYAPLAAPAAQVICLATVVCGAWIARRGTPDAEPRRDEDLVRADLGRGAG